MTVTTRPLSWAATLPQLRSMFFHLGHRRCAILIGVGVGTVFRLVNGSVKRPHPSTHRDVLRALDAWRADSQTERTHG